jgi:hypothetical protein
MTGAYARTRPHAVPDRAKGRGVADTTVDRPDAKAATPVAIATAAAMATISRNTSVPTAGKRKSPE